MQRLYKTGLIFVLIAFLGWSSSSIQAVQASRITKESPSDQIEFRDIGFLVDHSLQGPYDSIELDFSLPPTWKLNGGAILQLNLTAYFSSMMIGQGGGGTSTEGQVVGYLTAILNGVALQTELLQSNGNASIDIPIPVEGLIPDPISRIHHLVFQWDASASCDYNLTTNVVIHPASKLSLPHDISPMQLDLAWYPSPLYMENAPFSSGVTVVVPDQPSQSEMQAAIAVAAGLGMVSESNLNLGFAPISQLPITLRDTTHLVLVGKLENFEVLRDKAPEKARDTDGVILEIVSPWNAERVILAVTGKTDLGVLKAGEALNTGKIITTADNSIAIVQEVQKAISVVEYNEDMNFNLLTMEDLTFRDFGSTRKTIAFTIPTAVAIGADSYIDIAFNHSQLIDYLRSGMILRINGQPVGSVRLSDATASFNQFRIIVPPTAVHVGVNHLEIQVDLIPRNICTDPRRGSLWVTIFGSSLIHMPVAGQIAAGQQVKTLGQYPLAIVDDLPSSAIILPGANPPSWYVAVRLAYDLGAQAGIPGYPELIYAESMPTSVLSERNLIIIGSPALLPFMADLNPLLPASFNASGELAAEMLARITYQIDDAQSVGYLELGQTGSGKVIFAVLGSNGAGVQAAGSVLQNLEALKQLASGNLAIIQGNRLIIEYVTSGDQTVLDRATQNPVGGAVTPEPPGGGTARTKPEVWILPAIVISVGLIILLLGLEIFAFLEKRRA